ncbi:acyltransferase family protein [Sphingobium nicotianae]|uniref:Acyltransferase n=1 Tax=Sphingobium nicotianae TaxID=2782607 RepID=A0A9X1DFH0_9SPHN|nr:acyltransferase [Sphingobium nicotianae]MBT2188914.1 acyltransferase [Sphingobium nicotianae]
MSLAISAPRHRYVALDSLRGICACMVILYHIPSGSAFAQLPVIRHGGLFVDFFFVLSGLVIGSSYGQRLADGYALKRYMTLRFFRVYPLHLVMLLIYLAFEVGFALLAPGGAGRRPFEGSYSLPSFISALFLVQIFFGRDATPWNGPSWSNAAEFWTYLIFAGVMKLLPRLTVPLCILVALAVPPYLAVLTDRNINVGHDGALARCLYGFAMGLLCWKLPARLRERSNAPWVDDALELAMVALCVAFVWVAGVTRLSLAAPLVFFLVVVIFSRQRGIVSRLLGRAPFVMLGTLSYSIYMIHGFLLWRYLNVLSVGARFTGLDLVRSVGGETRLTSDPLLYGLLVAVFFAGVLVAAHLSCRLIEEPGRNLGKTLGARRRDDDDGTPVMPAGVNLESA